MRRIDVVTVLAKNRPVAGNQAPDDSRRARRRVGLWWPLPLLAFDVQRQPLAQLLIEGADQSTNTVLPCRGRQRQLSGAAHGGDRAAQAKAGQRPVEALCRM